MRRRECEGKAANGLRRQPACDLARDMGGMVVEDDLDCRIGGVGGVEELEKLDEFATAVAFLDQGMDVTSEQIDPGHQGQGAVALVLVIAHRTVPPRQAPSRQGRASLGSVCRTLWLPLHSQNQRRPWTL